MKILVVLRTPQTHAQMDTAIHTHVHHTVIPTNMQTTHNHNDTQKTVNLLKDNS